MIDELKIIRWQQRFQNMERASRQLQRGLSIESPSDIEQQGIIKSFEFTFELAWKTMKDFLESQGVLAGFPREVIKQAYHYDLITDGSIWLEMLGKRNVLAHTYDEIMADEAYTLIKDRYTPLVMNLVDRFRVELQDEKH